MRIELSRSALHQHWYIWQVIVAQRPVSSLNNKKSVAVSLLQYISDQIPSQFINSYLKKVISSYASQHLQTKIRLLILLCCVTFWWNCTVGPTDCKLNIASSSPGSGCTLSSLSLQSNTKLSNQQNFQFHWISSNQITSYNAILYR